MKPNNPAKGTSLPKARLDEAKVKAIRENRHGWPAWKWAELYNVHIRTIDKVRNYGSWRHV